MTTKPLSDGTYFVTIRGAMKLKAKSQAEAEAKAKELPLDRWEWGKPEAEEWD